MALQGVLRAGHVQIRVTDMTAALKHYTDVLGLIETGRDNKGCVYLKAWDEFDHHSVVLREADSPGMDLMAFKVSDDDSLDRFESGLREFGVEVESIPEGQQLALGRRVAFVAPAGHRFELYVDKEVVGNGLPEVNPDVWPDGLVGMHPTHFDHCLLYGDGVAETVKLFTDVLDFNVTEQVVSKDGGLIGAFLTCSTKTHDVAFIQSPDRGRFHHAAFYLESWGDIQRAADIIRKNDVSLDIGPTRHGISRGLTVYFFDPSGNRNEVFAGGYMYYPDRPTITWTEDQLGKAIFYYEGRINERFLTVTT
ncbi:MAG: catechol 2,3-dioxygenase [Kiloniellales bacterium]